jgi:hypothetical protein
VNKLISHRTFIRYIRWRWLIRLLYQRKRGWELEIASDDLLSDEVKQRLAADQEKVSKNRY